MANFTSTQDGNWNDGATWGNASPGSKGTEWPGAPGDTFTIAAGHTVIYNVSETNELGVGTIDGILTFLASVSTLLTMSHNTITVNNGGELRIGTSGTPIAAANTAKLLWNTTADNTKGLTIAAGGKVEIHGDPAYYGSDDHTTLQASWTSGQTFTIVGNYSAKWVSGQTLTVHRGFSYSLYSSDVVLVTLNGAPSNATNSVCTINEAFTSGTFTAGSAVVNVSRNVQIGKYGASQAINSNNTNRPVITDNNTVSGNYNASNTDFIGNYAMCAGTTLLSNGNSFLNVIIRNGNYGISAGTGHTISGNLYSCSNGLNTGTGHTVNGNVYACSSGLNTGTGHIVSGNIYSCSNGTSAGIGHTISGNLYSCTFGISAGTGHTVSGNIYSCSSGISAGTGHTVSGNIYSCTYGINASINITITGKLGFTSTNATAANTYDFRYNTGIMCTLRGCKTANPPTFYEWNQANQYILSKYGVYIEDYLQVVGDHRSYLLTATCIKQSTTLRSGGASNAIEIIPLSNCSITSPARIFDWTELDVPSSAQIRSVYVKGLNWSSYPTSSQLYLEAEYYNAASGVAKTIIASTQVLTDNTTWTALSVTFTPGQVSNVRYRLWLKTYAATCEVFVDNMLVRQ